MKTESINGCIDITRRVGNTLEKAGYGSDSNDEADIKKAGIWDLMDSIAGKGRFDKEEAQVELDERLNPIKDPTTASGGANE